MISIKNLNKSYNNKKVLENINLDILENEQISIIGKSGCGKSTLIRCIARLENFDSGNISIDGEDIYNIKEYYKKVGMVFQSFNLFENLTVLENLIIAPVKLKLYSKKDAIKISKKYLKQIGLEDKINEYPKNLSGGEKQRVAIIRTLIEKPKYILLDEPTSSLDPQMKKEVLDLILTLKDLNMSVIVVSHELSFVKKFSSRVIFIDNKKVISDDNVENTFKSDNEVIKNFLKDIK